MPTIILNSTTTLPITAFNRNTYFNGEALTGNAYFTVNGSGESLYELINAEITSLQIKSSANVVIYDADPITAKIDSVNDSLNGEQMMASVNMTIQSNASAT